jgi:hypothetical protein
MDDAMRLACIVCLGEQSGSHFDWDAMRWRERN